MAEPHGFTWIERPALAALARPGSVDDFHWLRQNGLPVLLSLSEEPPRRDWVNDAGLMVVHEPIEDFEAPTQEQLARCVAVIDRANEQQMGVAVHCAAGLGRTGTVLAAYLVAHGLSARDATRTSVVFPDPLGPTRPTTSPARTPIEASRSAARSP